MADLPLPSVKVWLAAPAYSVHDPSIEGWFWLYGIDKIPPPSAWPAGFELFTLEGKLGGLARAVEPENNEPKSKNKIVK